MGPMDQFQGNTGLPPAEQITATLQAAMAQAKSGDQQMAQLVAQLTKDWAAIQQALQGGATNG